MRFSGSSNPSGGFVNTVINTVTVDPATVVAGVTGAVGSVTGAVGSVTGAVGSVTAPVTPDPASTIATVSTSVPFPFRDGFFWPCMSGESFPPIFSAASYSTSIVNNMPVVMVQGGQSSTWPAVPRTSFSGKTTITASGRFIVSIAPTAGQTHYVGFNVQTAHAVNNGPWAQIEILPGSVSGYKLQLVYLTSGGVVTTVAISDNQPINALRSFAITLSNTQLLVSIDGVNVATVNNAVWPSTYSGVAVAVPTLIATGAVGGRVCYATMAVAWT